MLSGILHSERAVGVNIQIMRAFVQLKKMIASNAKLVQKMEELEKKIVLTIFKLKPSLKLSNN